MNESGGPQHVGQNHPPHFFSPINVGGASVNFYEQQQMQHQRQGEMLTGLPVSDQAARICPNGRPPCCFVAFGFGGLAVIGRPSQSTSAGLMGSVSTPITISPLVKLPALLAAQDPASNAKARPSSDSLEGTLRLMASFPGPLGPTTGKEKASR